MQLHRNAAMTDRRGDAKRNGPVTVIVPGPEVWAAAKQLGKLDCLLTVDPGTVIVCNSARHREYMRKLVR